MPNATDDDLLLASDDDWARTWGAGRAASRAGQLPTVHEQQLKKLEAT